MLFEEPKWLWLILATLIPLLLHLVNKGNKSVVNVGSLEWLPKKDQQQSRKIKFQQFWLWLIRTLIFCSIAFILAKPFITKNEKIDNRHLLLVKDDIDKEILNSVLDTIETNKWQIKWLNWDLPAIEKEKTNDRNTKTIHPYEAIELLAFNNIHPLSVTVLGNYNEAVLKAKPVSKTMPINWILLPNKNENLKTKLAILKTKNSNKVIDVEQKKYLSKVNIANGKAENLPLIDFSLDTILIVYDENRKQAETVFAALKALKTYHKIEIDLIKIERKKLAKDLVADVVFWMSNDSVLNNNLHNKICKYDKSVIENTYTKNESNKIKLFNFDENNLQVADVLNSMLFENAAINKKYDELIDLPLNNTFTEYGNSVAHVSAILDISKKINFNNVLVSILFLLILGERLFCYVNLI